MLKRNTNKVAQPKATAHVAMWFALVAELLVGAFEAAWLFRGIF